MIWLAVLLSVVLAVLAALHLIWALGVWWPVRDETELARTVVGANGITSMPGAVPSALVTVALIAAAVWPWYMAEGTAPFGRIGGWLIAAVFLARGMVTYLPAWRRTMSEQPFARLDQTAFGPLCLALGVAFLVFTRSLP